MFPLSVPSYHLIGYHTQTRNRPQIIDRFLQPGGVLWRNHYRPTHKRERRISDSQSTNLVKRDPLAGLAEDVRNGLTTSPKRFLPKYFYDELGSQLFEAICLLPEYYLTRAENEILQTYADEIAASVEGQKTLLEMGSGSASKTRLVIEALLREQKELLFVPVDISATALESSSRILLQSYPPLRIEAYAADYFAGLAELGKTDRGRTLALFLGSNISNFDQGEAIRFLKGDAQRAS